MPSRLHILQPSPAKAGLRPTSHRTTGITTLTLGILSLAVVVLWQHAPLSEIAPAWFVKQEPVIPWKVLDEQDILSGATIPADTHTVFHMPLVDFGRIDREVLLGLKGEDVRYWGYCFPQNSDPAVLYATRSDLKGKMFLSEKERRIRAEEAEKNRERFSINNLPDAQDVQEMQYRPFTTIRHQMDTFLPGHLCYIMSEAPLAIALDTDNDRLNDEVEKIEGTSKVMPDSDADGIYDGTEYRTGTNPLLRDSDQDGLIDGIEDANWNGRISVGESDPRTWDTDRDGLCDGLCRVRLANRQEMYIGEDTNLNGQLDEDETSPIMIDTDEDGITDEHELLTCILTSKGVDHDCTGLNWDPDADPDAN